MSEFAKDMIAYGITFDLVALPILVGLGIYLGSVYDSVYEHVYRNYNYNYKGTENDLDIQSKEV